MGRSCHARGRPKNPQALHPILCTWSLNQRRKARLPWRDYKTVDVSDLFHSSPAALTLRSCSLTSPPSIRPIPTALRYCCAQSQVQDSDSDSSTADPGRKRSFPMNRMSRLPRVRLLALLSSVLLIASFSSAQTATGETLMLDLPRQ